MSNSLFIRTYYLVKPLIPRRLQILVRSAVIRHKRKKYADVWPIDERAGEKPLGWPGWPEGKRFSFILIHDVETQAGHDQCRHLAELEKELGFRSSFHFVPERYQVSPKLRKYLVQHGFEIGVHGLHHDGRDLVSPRNSKNTAGRINFYLSNWGASGHSSPSMQGNLNLVHGLNIEYDISTFDTDPFEPQPNGVRSIFPLYLDNGKNDGGFVELPYTLPQDFTLYVLMGEIDGRVWQRKLEWITDNGGMALVITHPDYMHFSPGQVPFGRYSARIYLEFLEYVKKRYEGEFWHVRPLELSRYIRDYFRPSPVRYVTKL